jgi:hypothetical protein
MTLTTAPMVALLASALLLCSACATTSGPSGEAEPVLTRDEVPATEGDPSSEEPPEPQITAETTPEPGSTAEQPQTAEEEEGDVALALAAAAGSENAAPADILPEVVITGQALERHEEIRTLVSEAQKLLREVELQYVFTGKGKKETLRGRPVAFALWSETKKEWVVAQVEIPRPPVKWKPGRKPLPFVTLTPGVTAQHVKGTGAERLMFSFSRGGEKLRVYGRKFPVFDSDLLKKKKWRAVVETAVPIVYLPSTEDTFDPVLVREGRDFLLSTARQAIEELRSANAPSVAYPGKLLADIVPAEVITTLAVIEQTDDGEFRDDPEEAVGAVLNQYGLKRGEAYRYSVSSASAVGPMQFTNRRGNGTYAMVVRRCPAAQIDPNFERGATNILNAMKAAICLFDIELNQMRTEIQTAYHDNQKVLGIFPVAAYNGGPKNVTKLYKAMTKMKVKLDELRPPGEQPPGKPVPCPCLWRATEAGVHPVTIPRYNRENRGYVEKYQNILSVFD